MSNIKTYLRDYYLFAVFFLSFMGMIGSLYISEVVGIPPCVLCYWQRIFMYPMVFISVVGMIRKDAKAYLYILPLNVFGFLISVYHNLLQSTNIFPKHPGGCDASGVTCTIPTEAFKIGDLFVSLEFLSMMAFAALLALTLGMVWLDRRGK